MYFYIKALHIIFVVTWFAGLFYMPRLFIYNTEANSKSENMRFVLQEQFSLMMRRLWYGITWPSAILTLIFGTIVMIHGGWDERVVTGQSNWLIIKLFFVAGLYAYHMTLHKILSNQLKGIFTYTSQQLRIWNEVATIFLIAIVMLATVKESMSFVWGLIGLTAFIIALLIAIYVYKNLRKKS